MQLENVKRNYCGAWIYIWQSWCSLKKNPKKQKNQKTQQLPLFKDDNISSSLSYQLSFMEVTKLGFFILNSDYLGNIIKYPKCIGHHTVPGT